MAEYFQDPYDDPKSCTAYVNDAFQTNESVSGSEYEAGHRVLKWGTEPPSMLYKTAASSVPIEIWDRVIDCLREEPATLRATEAVCRGWRTRSRFLLDRMNFGPQQLGTREEAFRVGRLLLAVPKHRQQAQRVNIKGNITADGKRGSLAHLATFAAMLAGILTRTERLHLESGEWMTRTIPDSIFLHLSTYASITELWLDDVVLPSISVLGRLVCALHGLEELRLDGISFTNTCLSRPGKRWVIPPNLRSLRLGRFGAASPEVLRGLVSIRLTTHCERLELEFVLNSMSDYSVQLLLRSTRKSLQELTVNVSPLLNLGGLEARDMVERCLNLSVSSQLSVLTMYIRLEGDTILLARNYDRIVALVNYAPAATLEQVKLNWTCSMEFMRVLNIRQELLRLCQEISQIDQILSHRRYIRLKQVKIEFWGIGGLWEEMGSIWTGLAPLWFPNMLSKGVLRATWNGQLLLNNKI